MFLDVFWSHEIDNDFIVLHLCDMTYLDTKRSALIGAGPFSSRTTLAFHMPLPGLECGDRLSFLANWTVFCQVTVQCPKSSVCAVHDKWKF
jgi:hypothetical protein